MLGVKYRRLRFAVMAQHYPPAVGIDKHDESYLLKYDEELIVHSLEVWRARIGGRFGSSLPHYCLGRYRHINGSWNPHWVTPVISGGRVVLILQYTRACRIPFAQ